MYGVIEPKPDVKSANWNVSTLAVFRGVLPRRKIFKHQLAVTARTAENSSSTILTVLVH
ncbi:hypothetical protein KCP76_07930 [Salmonella enterica subsp. enterica serovar Weltevreden]|nr:hypothetical protein KCP76_07930 [Salmonella enterica subsp. enterica serovar Weltevreden]